MINVRTKGHKEATKKVWSRQSGRWTQSCRQTGTHSDRRGRSYLLNLLVAGRHGRENATKFKRQEKMFRASKIIEEDPETWAKKITNQKEKVLPETKILRWDKLLFVCFTCTLIWKSTRAENKTFWGQTASCHRDSVVFTFLWSDCIISFRPSSCVASKPEF